MTCGIKLEARRNADFRVTFTSASRKFTFSGMVPLFSVRLGDVVLLQVGPSATPNGSNFVVVGDSVVLTIEKADMALLDSAAPDTDAETLFFDVTLTDGTGFENWLTGGPFILLGLNDVTCGGCNSTIEASLGGQCIQVSIEGGNLAAGASLTLQELNEAAARAEQAAEDAEAAAASIPALVVNKADTDGGNIPPSDAPSFRERIGAGRNHGEWDASLNVPEIVSAVGIDGDFYTVSVPGYTTIDGETNWIVGDVIRFDGTAWVKNPPLFKLEEPTAVIRTQAQKSGDIINVRDFGATGDGVTDDTAAFQRALDAAKGAGMGEIIIPPPVQSYIISDTLYYASETPIRLRASAPCSGFSVYTNRQATLTFVGPHNKHCLHFETSGATVNNPLRGLELDSILVRRLSDDFAAKGSGGAGFCLKGVVGFKLLNCAAVGFDNDLYLDDNPASAGANPIRCFAGYILGFIGMQAGSYRVLHKGAGEIVYDQPRLSIQGRAGYIADLAIMLGTNGSGPDHNHIKGGVLIGGSNRPDYNLFVNAGFFNKAENTSFERANIAGSYVTTNSGVGDRDHFSFNDCWWDGQPGYCLDVLAARVNVHNPRAQQLLAVENGGVAPTAPAFRFRGQTTPGTPIIGGSFTGGGVIYFTGPTAIEVDNLARMNIIPPLIVDRTASLKPCIILGANTARCSIISPQIGNATAEPQMGGGNHTYVGESGIRMGGGESILRWGGAKTAVMNASGVASVAHETTFAKMVSATAFLDNGTTKTPVPIQFIDGSNIQVSTTAADAGKTVTFNWVRTP